MVSICSNNASWNSNRWGLKFAGWVRYYGHRMQELSKKRLHSSDDLRNFLRIRLYMWGSWTDDCKILLRLACCMITHGAMYLDSEAGLEL